jgi:BASS family bile acid:Na+ symporter
MASGYGVGLLFRMELMRRRTLCIEIGMQNAGLGAMLATNNFPDNQIVALPAAAFVFVCIFTASLMVEIWQRNGKREVVVRSSQ